MTRVVRAGSVLPGLSEPLAKEQIDELATWPGVRIERIVSMAHASPPGFWYDQAWDEWICVISGSAAVLIDGEAGPRELHAGDWLELPAHVRHRVEWTDAAQQTVWLAVHGERR